MLSLYKSLVRPHVEYCSCAWNPYYRKDKELLEKIQHRYTKMMTNIQDKTYENRLQCLSLWTFQERRNRQDLTEVFRMPSTVTLHEHFTLNVNISGTKRYSCKLVLTTCTKDITKYFFPIKLLTDGICWTSRNWMH